MADKKAKNQVDLQDETPLEVQPLAPSPSPAPPQAPPSNPQMQDQGPSMEDLTRAQEMARQQLVKLPMRLAANRLTAIATHHDPNEVKEQDVVNELQRDSGLPEVMQRQAFEGTRAKQLLERAQGRHQTALATQEEDENTAGSERNRSTAGYFNGIADMFGAPFHVDPDKFVGTPHMQGIVEALKAYGQEATKRSESDKDRALKQQALDSLDKFREGQIDIGGRKAGAAETTAGARVIQAGAAATKAEKGPAGTALKPPSTKGTEQLKNQEALSTELDTMPKQGDALELRRWAKRVNDMAAVAVGAGRMQKLLMQNIGVNIPGGSDNMIKFLGEAAASPQYRVKLQGELKRMVANEREATIDAEERGFHDMSKWREKYPKQQPGGLPPIRTIGGQTFKLNPDGKTYDPVGAQPNG